MLLLSTDERKEAYINRKTEGYTIGGVFVDLNPKVHDPCPIHDRGVTATHKVTGCTSLMCDHAVFSAEKALKAIVNPNCYDYIEQSGCKFYYC